MERTLAARRDVLRRAYDAAVRAVDPARALRGAWPEPPAGRIVVLALGKAAAVMAAAAEAHYATLGRELGGVAVVPRGHAAPTRRVRVLEAGHPVPDEASRAAGAALLAAARPLGADDLALVLVSGGGSSLAVAPAGLSLDELAATVRELLASGAPIEATNAVRRRLDALKGGGLAAAAHPARTEALVISDVVGDAPLDVASGPSVGDGGTPRRALELLDRHGVAAPAARAALRAEVEGRRAGPPRPDDPRLARARTRVVAGAGRALEAAARVLEAEGVAVRRLGEIAGDARAAGRAQAELARRILARGEDADGTPLRPPVALLSGGETTVAVRGGGTGGRNSTFALALALALPDRAPVWALAADSDGVDGTGPHAGAFVDPELFARVPRAEAEALDREDDSRAVFARAGALLETGPTRANVNDLRFVWIDPPAEPPAAGAGPSAAEIEAAAARLRAGGLVAFPTETVYGLGALARDPAAVAGVFAAKGRPADHPLIVHLPDAGLLGAWAAPVPEAATRLAAAFWPGPLTLVLRRAPGVPDAVTGGQDTVGVRVPDHPLARALLAAVGDGVAAPSANRFGRISPTRAEHVREEFAGRDLLVLDGGPCRVGLESTILDLSGEAPRLLRPGAISVAELEAVLGAPVGGADAAAPRAPGRLRSHYAPRAPTRVLAPAALAAAPLEPGSGLLLRTAPPPAGHAGPSARLPADPEGYGRGLYDALRRLDAAGPPAIVVEAPPEGPGWAAVHDRLRRASAGAEDAAP